VNQAIAPAPLVNADADRQARISAQVHTRAGTCERTLHVWRLLLAGQSSSPGLRDRVTIARKMPAVTVQSQRARRERAEPATSPPSSAAVRGSARHGSSR
jgi:hypothetical protein